MPHILLIDTQEELYQQIDRKEETLAPILQLIKIAKKLSLPMTCTEQSPKILGSILPIVEDQLPQDAPIFSKHTFSCLGDEELKEHITKSADKEWVLIGLKAHICVLQTAKDLLKLGCDVTVPNDAIGTPNLYQLSSAIAEMRDMGVRITCTETLVFEWLGSDQHEHFDEIYNILHPKLSSCCQL